MIAKLSLCLGWYHYNLKQKCHKLESAIPANAANPPTATAAAPPTMAIPSNPSENRNSFFFSL